MENASKALLYASGVLFALLIIGAAVLSYQQIRESKVNEDNILLEKQISKFNLEYESYNKKLLHGIDVITVVNKAIDNNLKYSEKGSDKKWLINITMELKEKKYETTVERANKNLSKSKKETCSVDDYNHEDNKHYEISNYVFDGKEKIGEYQNNNTDWKPNENVVKFFENKTKVITDEPSGSKYIYYITPAIVNFKSDIFQCKNVAYNEDGRITEMTFEVT